MEAGTLYLVATPIGNLEDITFRALKVLNEVQLIAAEDTRHTLKLLNHFKIKNKLISYYQHNEEERSNYLIDQIKGGLNVALVSDAGMPGISDPGNILVNKAIANDVKVIPIPGASALTTALAASGLDTSYFIFKGFLPRKQALARAILEELSEFTGTIVLYESPYRIVKTLEMIYEVLGNRKIVLARELTKVHEEFIRGELEEIIKTIEKVKIVGEFTLLIEGSSKNETKQQKSTNVEFERMFEGINSTGSSLKEELRIIAKKTGKSLKEIYRSYLKYKEKKEE